MSYIVGYSVKYGFNPDHAVNYTERMKKMKKVDELYSSLKADKGLELASFKVYEFLEERI